MNDNEYVVDTAVSEPVEQPESADTSTNEPESEQTTDAPEEVMGDSEEKADELEALKSELKLLRAQLEGERALYGRLSAECAEFSNLYPTVPLSELPDGVWESVKKGVPIAAAYALHERKATLERAKADLINGVNSRSSSGSVDSPPAEEYFTPDEVRAMSAAQVRTNYSTIIRSMSKWH